MSWKKVLLVALVVLLVLIGLPILMPGMGAAACVDCGPAVMTGLACALAAVALAGFALAVTVLFRYLRLRRDLISDLLRAVAFERPPQLA